MKVIVGGGVSGLSAAYYILKSSRKTKVLVAESGDRLGGWIQSVRHDSGLLFEQGPRTIRPRYDAGINTLELVEDLGLAPLVKGIPANHPTAQNRMICVDGKLYSLPSSVLQAFSTIPPFTRPLVSAILKDICSESKLQEDESIYSFVERRLGRELADYAISPMICGICAGDAKEISVKFLMKSLFELEQKHGSITRGLLSKAVSRMGNIWNSPKTSPLGNLAMKAKKERWSVWSLEGGLEILPSALVTNVTNWGASIQTNASCSRIAFKEGGAVLTIGKEKQEVFAQHIISTVTAARLAPLLIEQHPILSKELAQIPTVTVAVVNLAFKGRVLQKDAFGFLIPPSEGNPILGVIFDTCSFPQDGYTVLTVMLGGRWFDSRLGKEVSSDSIVETAVKHVRSILGIEDKTFAHHVAILRDCIPQYVVGHHARVQRIRDYIQKHKLPLSLAGSSYDGVGVNDVILSAKRAAFEIQSLKH